MHAALQIDGEVLIGLGYIIFYEHPYGLLGKNPCK